ncbi:MAG: 6-bladed beta-propeller [Bacteroidota bacterium]
MFRILVLLLFIGCTPGEQPDPIAMESESSGESALTNEDKVYPKIESSLDNVSFQKVFAVGDSDEVFLSAVGEIFIDADEKIFIADKSEIKVFDKNGAFVQVLGRKGRGPGEFNNFGNLNLRASTNRLYVFDEGLSRINVFDLKSLEYLNVVPVNPNNWKSLSDNKRYSFTDFLVTPDDSLIIGLSMYNEKKGVSQSDSTSYYFMNTSGEISLSSLLNVPDNGFYKGSGVPKPVSPITPLLDASTRSTIVDIDSKGNLYIANTQNIQINIKSILDEVERSVTYAFERAELRKEDIIKSYKNNPALYRKAKEDSYPDTWPAFDFFFVDDEERIWISTIINDEENYEWWILSSDGALLGTFKWPGQRLQRHRIPRQIKEVRRGYLYTIEENPGTSAKEVVKYRIVVESQN